MNIATWSETNNNSFTVTLYTKEGSITKLVHSYVAFKRWMEFLEEYMQAHVSHSSNVSVLPQGYFLDRLDSC